MPIDPSNVQWDEPASQTPGAITENAKPGTQSAIDASKVQWDAGPAFTPPKTGAGADQIPGTDAHAGFQPQPKGERSTMQKVGDGAKELGRQVGLTARHGLEGLAQAAEIVTEPIRIGITDPALRAVGLPEGRPMGKVAEGIADAASLPTPQTATERVVGDAARFAAGGAGMAGAARKVSQAVTLVAQQALGSAAPQAAKGPLAAAADAMAANPGMQAVSAAGAGAAGGAAREAGEGAASQAVFSVGGGLGAAGLAQAARAGVGTIARLAPASGQNLPQQVEQALEGRGIAWADVPAGIRASLQAEAEKAMRTGSALDGDALERLLTFKTVGATPTRGTLTLDPVQITREQNLARTGANSQDAGLHGLARIQNENNATLIRNLNDLGASAADDAFSAGSRAIDSLRRGLDGQKANVDTLYSQARDSAGRSFPLDGHAFTTTASKLLDDNLLGGALPASVQTHLNRIASGQVPFTVDYGQQLATAIGKLQRATHDGQVRMALGMVRQALDDAPVMGLGQQTLAAGARAVNPGGLPAAPGAQVGQEALQAFSRARAANRQMMQGIERIPGLKAVYDGTAAPDDFIQRHIISRSARAADTKQLANLLRKNDPETFEAVRASIAQHLKQAAIGTAQDETGRFSAKGYNQARLRLGEHKLRQFFTPEEMNQLRAVGKVAEYTTAQPAGSAVNNSNSGTFLAGRGLDFINALSAKVPLLGLGDMVGGIGRGMQQGQAQNIGPALVRQQAERNSGRAAALWRPWSGMLQSGQTQE